MKIDKLTTCQFINEMTDHLRGRMSASSHEARVNPVAHNAQRKRKHGLYVCLTLGSRGGLVTLSGTRFPSPCDDAPVVLYLQHTPRVQWADNEHACVPTHAHSTCQWIDIEHACEMEAPQPQSLPACLPACLHPVASEFRCLHPTRCYRLRACESPTLPPTSRHTHGMRCTYIRVESRRHAVWVACR
jgi:hypothetical protein